MKRYLRTWILSLGTILVVILIFMLSAFTTDAEQDEVISQILNDLPDAVKKTLKEEGVDLEELNNDPELRREMQKKMMDNPEIREQFQNMSGEKRKSEAPPPQGKSEGKQRGPKGGKRQGQGGGAVDEYYKSIVDNNLFRPLGWKGEEKGGPAFRLVGTVIARGRAPKALIFEFARNVTHYVAVGGRIGNATVTSIEEKSVTLNQDGEGPLTLNIMQESPFLGGSGGGGGGGGRPQVGGSPPSPPKNIRGGMPGGKNISREERKNLKEKIQNMSPQEREKVIQKMGEEGKASGSEFREGGQERRDIIR